NGQTTDEDDGCGGEEAQRSDGGCEGPQAASADARPHHPRSDPDPPDLQVRQEPPVGAILRVADVVSVLRSLAADLAFLCHGLLLRWGNEAGLYHRPCQCTSALRRRSRCPPECFVRPATGVASRSSRRSLAPSPATPPSSATESEGWRPGACATASRRCCA